MKSQLTAKQIRFVEEYLIDACAAKAATRAGYSKRNAAKIGYELLEKTLVLEELRKRQVELSLSRRVTAEAVLEELAALAFSNIGDVVDLSNPRSLLTQIPKAASLPIQQISLSEDGSVSVKLYDKLQALSQLGKHLGLFRDSKDDCPQRDPKKVLYRLSEIFKGAKR